MKNLSAAAFNKLVKKVAYKSRPHAISANYTLNASYGLNWYVHVHGDDTFTSIGSYDTDAIKKLKLAAQRGVVPGEEVKA